MHFKYYMSGVPNIITVVIHSHANTGTSSTILSECDNFKLNKQIVLCFFFVFFLQNTNYFVSFSCSISKNIFKQCQSRIYN